MITPAEFRTTLRHWASGVTVVTTERDGVPYGMTVSAFSSVSAEPPLILVCTNGASTTGQHIGDTGLFAVNVLAADQAELSGHFASGDTTTRFDDIGWRIGAHGAPLLDGVVAHLECRVHNAHPEGSHILYIGEVLATHVAGGAPLLYHDGAYAHLQPAS